MEIWHWSLVVAGGIVGFLIARFPELQAAWKANRDKEANLKLRLASDVFATGVVVREVLFTGCMTELRFYADGRSDYRANYGGGAVRTTACRLARAAATKMRDPERWTSDEGVHRSVEVAYAVLSTSALVGRLSRPTGMIDAHGQANAELALEQAFRMATRSAEETKECADTLSELLMAKVLRFGRFRMGRTELRKFFEANPPAGRMSDDGSVRTAPKKESKRARREKPTKARGKLRLVDKDFTPDDK